MLIEVSVSLDRPVVQLLITLQCYLDQQGKPRVCVLNVHALTADCDFVGDAIHLFRAVVAYRTPSQMIKSISIRDRKLIQL